jgi:hypothetical protein
MPKMYRTASGKLVDFEAMQLKNEHVPAIGNMRVNARGDQLGPNGEVIRRNNERVAEHYNDFEQAPPLPPPPVLEESLPPSDPAPKEKNKKGK